MNSNNQKKYEFPLYLFYQGKNYEAYKFFGVHSVEIDGEKVYCFRVWAPNAVSVSVVGDFNGWDMHRNPMQQIEGYTGIWETFIPNLKHLKLISTALRRKTAVLR